MPVPTLLGVTVGATVQGVKYVRTGNIPNDLLAAEAAFRADSANPAFRFAADRNAYLFLTAALNTTNLNANHTNNRLPIFTHKYDNPPNTLWAVIGAADVGSAIYNNIVARGNEIAAWQAAHRGLGKWGCTAIWTFHHEGNQSATISAQGGSSTVAATNWRAALQNILDIWVNVCGVTLWQGLNDMTTLVEGLIPCICLVSGSNAGPGQDNDINIWWGNNAYMNATCVMNAPDLYNIGAQNRTFANLFAGQKAFNDAKAISQAAAGRPFLTGILEYATEEPGFYDSNHSSWTALGIPYTKSAHMLNAAAYMKTIDLNLFCWWDAVAANPQNLLDSSLDAYNGYINAFINDPFFGVAGDTIPPGAAAGATQVFLLDDELV